MLEIDQRNKKPAGRFIIALTSNLPAIRSFAASSFFQRSV